MKLDRTDFEIIRVLQENARISNKELAEINGISQSTCLERVRRLGKHGVLKSFTAEIAPSFLGIGLQAMISLRLKQHDDLSFAALFNELSARREVLNVYLLAGSIDFLVHVAVRDVMHLRSIVLESYSARSEVAQVETSLIFDFHRNAQLPNYSAAAEQEVGSSDGEHI